MEMLTIDVGQLDAIYRYVMYLLGGVFLLLCFGQVYVRVTPYDEMALIRAGVPAAALSFGGALLGFALTLAACALFHSSYLAYLGWALLSMLVQLLAYVAMSRMIPDLAAALVNNNVAVGGFMAAVSLSLGVLNAACLF